MSLVARLAGAFVGLECTCCGRKPGERFRRTVGGHGGPRAPDWIPRDSETKLRFCSDGCRALYRTHGGIPPWHEVQPRTIEEEKLAHRSEIEHPTMTEEGDWVAVRDVRVGRNVSTSFIIARAVVAGAILLALADLPYGYYQLLRMAVCGVGVWGVYETIQANRTGWAWVFGVLAIVFNPIAPLYMSRETWAIVDVVAAATLIVSLRYAGPRRDVPTTKSNYPWWKETR